MRVLRVGVIRCAILSCVVVFDEVSNMLILLLPALLPPLILLVILRCEIDEGDSIDEGVKALHIDSMVMAINNSGSNIVILLYFCKEDCDCSQSPLPFCSCCVIYYMISNYYM